MTAAPSFGSRLVPEHKLGGMVNVVYVCEEENQSGRTERSGQQAL